MEHRPNRKLYLAASDGTSLADPKLVAKLAAERAALEAIWRRAELDAAELRMDAARFRAEQAAERAGVRRRAIGLA